jgi:hypothetical protein
MDSHVVTTYGLYEGHLGPKYLNHDVQFGWACGLGVNVVIGLEPWERTFDMEKCSCVGIQANGIGTTKDEAILRAFQNLEAERKKLNARWWEEVEHPAP